MNPNHQENVLKIVRRKEAKLRKMKCPIIPNSEKRSMNITMYIRHLDRKLYELSNTMEQHVPQMFVAVGLQENTCAICLEKLQDGEDISHFNCCHYLHSTCLFEWNRNCPVCRCQEIEYV